MFFGIWVIGIFLEHNALNPNFQNKIRNYEALNPEPLIMNL